jgi:hypothetical protein
VSATEFDLRGTCPACGENTLTIALTGRKIVLVCAYIACPRPTALDEILTTCSQPEHIVDLRATDYSMQHPMIERLDGVLLDRCPLAAFLSLAAWHHLPLGRYAVSRPVEADDWSTATWTPVEVSS